MSEVFEVFDLIIQGLNSVTNSLINNPHSSKQKALRELFTAYLVIEKIEDATERALSALTDFQNETHIGERVSRLHVVGGSLNKIEALMGDLARWVQDRGSSFDLTTFSSGFINYIKYLGVLDTDWLYGESEIYLGMSMTLLRNEIQAVTSPSPQRFPPVDTVKKVSGELKRLLVEIRTSKEKLEKCAKEKFLLKDFFYPSNPTSG